MAKLFDLRPAQGAKRPKKREGRGNAGYGGKTAGKGMNGQGARKSPDIRPQFEGGQTPLYRRLPKRQYIPAFNKVTSTAVNLSVLEGLDLPANAEITPEYLLEVKAIKKLENGGLKVLANGNLTKAYVVKAHAFSAAAAAQITAAGGQVELLS